MQSIDALCDAVTAFGGGVVVISHDSTLLDALCDDTERAEVWIVEGGEVRKWHSDFADYKDSLIQEIKGELDEDDRTFGRGAYAKPVAMGTG
jgi:ATPase subunit of ABC transporter with duplicated ATPase domains